MTTNKCWQLFEVAYNYESALTHPTTFEGALASWRLVTDWLKRQPGWRLIDKVVQADQAYATYHRPDGMLEGLWVKEAIYLPEPQDFELTTERQWLARAVTVSDASEDTRDVFVALDQTPVDGLVDWLRDGTDDYADSEQNARSA